MSETKLATKADLKEMYDRMLPYLGGSADAGFTPIGTVISVMSNHAPANYLICDGTVYNIADYPELANHFLNEFGSKNKFGGNGTTTFAVPNLSGEFLRMTGTNSHANQGSGANVGEHQDATRLLAMQIYYNGSNILEVGVGSPSSATPFSDDAYADKVVSRDQYTSGTISASRRTSDLRNQYITTRPTNTSVLYCIATKNIYLNPSLDYSTDEKVVGTWINGKPLYQKTIQLNTLELESSRYQSITLLGVTNLDKIIDFKCIGFASTGSEIPVPFRSINVSGELDNNFCSLFFTNGYFDLRSQTDRSTMTFYCTFQYTKTTS